MQASASEMFENIISADTKEQFRNNHQEILVQLNQNSNIGLLLGICSNIPAPALLADSRARLLKSYFSEDELAEMVRQYSKPEFALIRQQKAQICSTTTSFISPHTFFQKLNTKDIENEVKLMDRFKQNSPINRHRLIQLAQTVEKNECICFTNPSSSIRESWNNKLWERLCFAAITLSKEMKHPDALSHYRWLSYARYEIAQILKQQRDNTCFGYMRIDSLFQIGLQSSLVTRIENGGGYADQYDYCNTALANLEKATDNTVKHHTVKIGNKSIPITIILDPETKTALCILYRTLYKGKSTIVIEQAHPLRTYTVFKTIQKLYEQIDNTQDLDIIYKNLGKIFWYISQTGPNGAGSAAGTLLYFYDILNRKNLPLAPFQGKISPDLIAIFEPLEKFSNGFRQLLTSAPEVTVKNTP